MEVGLIRRVDIDQEMQQAYLDYAMSVIVARALPDARDGLKPVQRRILYAMQDLNLSPDTAFKKSARIVGEVLGKYHPHGDVAVYEAMARLAQDFSMRYPLVDGQGNFGSIDGDPPAAMRYTEARLTRFATELMAQIDRNTVDFGDNFDGTLREPLVLPAAVPNLLVNGASGIAVGMATSIPPHNLTEVVDALRFMLGEWEHLDDVAVPDLMRFIKGPDFPTGGIILQESGENAMEAAYGSGRGRMIVRGRVHAEDLGRGRTRLIITELPYQVNKTNLIERIAELAREGDLDGISDLRDESDRQGMRIVIELKQGADMEGTLRGLYKSTPLQNTFGVNLLALVDGEPRLLNLKQALRVFIEHRLVVVRRRSEYDLARAQHRAHILEGLRVALKNLDEIIALIRAASDAEQARSRLMKRYSLSEIQAQAILDMQLRRLASLERKKIEDEYREVSALIKELEILLKSPRQMREVVAQELDAMKQAYGDRRRTQIVSLEVGATTTQFLTASDLAPSQNVWVGVTPDGRIARSHTETLPDLSGEGKVRHLIQTSTRGTIYLLAQSGAAAAVAVSTLAEAETFAGGAPLYKSCAFAPEDRLAGMFTVNGEEGASETMYALAVSRQGMIKKTTLAELPGPSAQKFTLIKINPGDEAVAVMVSHGSDSVALFSQQGMGIRFSEEDVRAMGLVAAGVMGIKLGEGDAIASAMLWDEKADVLLLASDGGALRAPASDFPQQGRYGQGVIACRLAAGTKIAAALQGGKKAAALVVPASGDVRKLRVGDVPAGKRAQKPGAVSALKGIGAVSGLIAIGEQESAKPRKAEDGEKPAQGKAGAAKPTAEKKDAGAKKNTAAASASGTAKKTPARAGAKTAPEAAPAPAATAKKTAQVSPPAVAAKAKPVRGKAETAALPQAETAAVNPARGKATPAKTAAAKAELSAAKPARGKAAPAAEPAAAKPARGKTTPANATIANAEPAPTKPARGKAAPRQADVEEKAAVKPAASRRPGAGKTAGGSQAALPGIDD
jgi:DNA gyrase subunit A